MQKHDFGHVLVTSASSKVPLIRAVQNATRKLHPTIQVIAGDMNEEALTFFAADSFWKMPRTIDRECEFLMAGCKERGVRTIVPTRDGELLFWARYQPRFAEAGISIVVSPESSISVCLDKLEFSGFGKKHGLPFIPASIEIGEIDAPTYVVKERYGAGSRKMGLNLSRGAALEHARILEHPIYQPFVSGNEVSVDAWLDRRGKVKGVILRRRDRVVNGESQITTTFRNEKVEAEATGILEALQLRGPVVMQLFIDGANQIHVIECNSRFGGASTASIAAGLDVFYWSLLEAQGADLAEYPFERISGELRQIRVPADVIVHGHHF
ncbi:MAG TPA: ATP-grasp domain-containing protein [Burkholderiales bacterium]|nr:ATP-grasp domain-containing protein [Burkholderiales bacterium]